MTRREATDAHAARTEDATRPGRAVAASPRSELARGGLGCLSGDELAQQDICAALLSTPGLDARAIEVQMTGAGVLLRGAVARPADRARALRIAKRRAGHRPVREELTIRQSGPRDPAQPAGAALTAR